MRWVPQAGLYLKEGASLACPCTACILQCRGCFRRSVVVVVFRVFMLLLLQY
jgi:hypothetical protein